MCIKNLFLWFYGHLQCLVFLIEISEIFALLNYFYDKFHNFSEKPLQKIFEIIDISAAVR